MLRPLSSKVLKEIKKRIKDILKIPISYPNTHITVNISYNDYCISTNYSMLCLGELNVPLSLEMGIKVYICYVPVYIDEFYNDFKLDI